MQNPIRPGLRLRELALKLSKLQNKIIELIIISKIVIRKLEITDDELAAELAEYTKNIS